MVIRFLPLVLLSAFLSVGCGDSSTDSNAPAKTPDQTSAAADPANLSLPASLLLASAPEGFQEIAALKQTVKDGDKVVVSGVVGGRVDPIAENRAILTLLDTSIKTCNMTPGDGCETPWDACCEPADVRTKNSLTVQVVDAEGRPLKTSLATVEGVKPLARLIVRGSAKVSGDGVVVVNADGMYVLP